MITYHVTFETDAEARAEFERLRSNIEVSGIGFSYGFGGSAVLAITVADGVDIASITPHVAVPAGETLPAQTQEETPAEPESTPATQEEDLGGEFES